MFKLILSNLKSKVHKIVFDKLVPVYFNLSKPSDGVKNGVVTKDANNAQIKNIEDKILDIMHEAANITLNTNMNEVKKSTQYY